MKLKVRILHRLCRNVAFEARSRRMLTRSWTTWRLAEIDCAFKLDAGAAAKMERLKYRTVEPLVEGSESNVTRKNDTIATAIF